MIDYKNSCKSFCTAFMMVIFLILLFFIWTPIYTVMFIYIDETDINNDILNAVLPSLVLSPATSGCLILLSASCYSCYEYFTKKNTQKSDTPDNENLIGMEDI